VRISVGGTIAPPGVWAILSPPQRPEDVSVVSGKVSYRLTYLDSSGQQYGLMIVQMLTDSQIKIEVFVGSEAATAEFDAPAQVYIR
jgi:hypothetical protein